MSKTKEVVVKKEVTIIRRRTGLIAGTPGFQFVYFLVDQVGTKSEIGRTTWSDVNAFMGAANKFEEGLIAAFESLGYDVNITSDSTKK